MDRKAPRDVVRHMGSVHATKGMLGSGWRWQSRVVYRCHRDSARLGHGVHSSSTYGDGLYSVLKCGCRWERNYLSSPLYIRARNIFQCQSLQLNKREWIECMDTWMNSVRGKHCPSIYTQGIFQCPALGEAAGSEIFAPTSKPIVRCAGCRQCPSP